MKALGGSILNLRKLVPAIPQAVHATVVQLHSDGRANMSTAFPSRRMSFVAIKSPSSGSAQLPRWLPSNAQGNGILHAHKVFVLRGLSVPSGARMMSDATVSESAPPPPVPDVDIVEIVTAIDPIPSGWWPSQIMEALFVNFHDWIGLPWGFTIIAATVGIRVFLLPLILFQVRCVCIF